jgi:hypothetical protein
MRSGGGREDCDMDNRHFAALSELFESGGEWDECKGFTADDDDEFKCVLSRHSMTLEEVNAAIEELLSENDIENAAIGLASVNLTYPDQDTDEYFEAHDLVTGLRCPLLRLHYEGNCPDELTLRAEEMENMIAEGAERLAAGLPFI